MNPHVGMKGVASDDCEKILTLVELTILSRVKDETVWIGLWDDGERAIGVSLNDGTFSAVTLTPARARQIAVRLGAWADAQLKRGRR